MQLPPKLQFAQCCSCMQQEITQVAQRLAPALWGDWRIRHWVKSSPSSVLTYDYSSGAAVWIGLLNQHLFMAYCSSRSYHGLQIFLTCKHFKGWYYLWIRCKMFPHFWCALHGLIYFIHLSFLLQSHNPLMTLSFPSSLSFSLMGTKKVLSHPCHTGHRKGQVCLYSPGFAFHMCSVSLTISAL